MDIKFFNNKMKLNKNIFSDPTNYNVANSYLSFNINQYFVLIKSVKIIY